MSQNCENYGWVTSSSPYSHSYLIPAIISCVQKLKPRRILDIGSGNGSLSSVLNKAGYYVAGVEYDKEGYRISKENNPRINYYNMSVYDETDTLMSNEDRFDCVISTEVIEHLYTPKSLINFASNVLVSDGVIVLTTPYHGYLKNLAISLVNGWDKHHTSLWNGGHIKFWSRNTLEQLLNENGFKIIEFKGVGRFPYIWKSMLIVAKKI